MFCGNQLILLAKKAGIKSSVCSDYDCLMRRILLLLLLLFLFLSSKTNSNNVSGACPGFLTIARFPEIFPIVFFPLPSSFPIANMTTEN